MRTNEEIIRDLKILAEKYEYDLFNDANDPSKPDTINVRFQLNEKWDNRIELPLTITKCLGLRRYQVTFPDSIKPDNYPKTKYDKMLKDIEGWLQNNRGQL